MGEYATFLSKIEEYEADLLAEFPISPHIPTHENIKAIAKLIEHEITKCMVFLSFLSFSLYFFFLICSSSPYHLHSHSIEEYEAYP